MVSAMPTTCAAIKCPEERSRDSFMRGITFHGFPKDPFRRKQWRIAVRRQTPDKKLWEPSKSSCLCSKHFKLDMFDKTGQTVRLRDNAVPTEFDFPPHLKIQEFKPRKTRTDVNCEQVIISPPEDNILPSVYLDHQYAIRSIDKMKKTLQIVEEQRDFLAKKLRNAELREQRLHTTCTKISNELERNQCLVNELRMKLESLSGDRLSSQ